MWVKLTATVVMLTGFLIALQAYIREPSLPAQVAEQLGPVYRFLYNKWYFDELYHFLFVRPAFWLGRCSGSAATKGSSTASALTAPRGWSSRALSSPGASSRAT
jgi:NADH:ubiquinone oxidoreductase subunit 5 (subunit L)/multisubunit Na+/H+ antiporter MnhA subunit